MKTSGELFEEYCDREAKIFSSVIWLQNEKKVAYDIKRALNKMYDIVMVMRKRLERYEGRKNENSIRGFEKHS